MFAAPFGALEADYGAKSEWLNRRLRVNGDIFYYNYSNQQVLSVVGSTAGTQLSNAGASHVKGAEIEVEAAPIKGARIAVAFGYTDARYTQFEDLFNGGQVSLAGNYLPYAPRFTGSALGSYTWNLNDTKALTAETNWTYRSTVFYDPFNLTYTSDGTLVQWSTVHPRCSTEDELLCVLGQYRQSSLFEFWIFPRRVDCIANIRRSTHDRCGLAEQILGRIAVRGLFSFRGCPAWRTAPRHPLGVSATLCSVRSHAVPRGRGTRF